MASTKLRNESLGMQMTIISEIYHLFWYLTPLMVKPIRAMTRFMSE
jgi:hypothetical protein